MTKRKLSWALLGALLLLLYTAFFPARPWPEDDDPALYPADYDWLKHHGEAAGMEVVEGSDVVLSEPPARLVIEELIPGIFDSRSYHAPIDTPWPETLGEVINPDGSPKPPWRQL